MDSHTICYCSLCPSTRRVGKALLPKGDYSSKCQSLFDYHICNFIVPGKSEIVGDNYDGSSNPIFRLYYSCIPALHWSTFNNDPLAIIHTLSKALLEKEDHDRHHPYKVQWTYFFLKMALITFFFLIHFFAIQSSLLFDKQQQ